jgi:alpha-tubulin suppressor-like RCC1 family protein
MAYKSQNIDVTSSFLKNNTLKNITKFGHIFLWGDNSVDGRSGIIGDGTTISRSSPVQLQSSQFWKKIDVTGHSLAIKIDGTLWAWGKNEYGQLGTDTTINLSSPVQIGVDTNWDSIAAGNAHSCAVKTDGTLWCWGRNDYGQLGTNTSITINTSSPVQVGANTFWKYVACGMDTTFAIRGKLDEGKLYSWGDNQAGSLGINSSLLGRSSPVQVGANNNWKLVEASSGVSGSHVLAIKTDGTLWTWGKPQERLGTGAVGFSRSSPVQIFSSSDWKKIAGPHSLASGIHVLAIKTDGTLWGWGNNNFGQLGVAEGILSAITNARSSPIQISNQTGWTEISVSQDTSFALKDDGTLWAWGRNEAGAFGNNQQESSNGSPSIYGTLGVSSPTQIITDRKWSKISSSKLFTPFSSGNTTIAAISNLYY